MTLTKRAFAALVLAHCVLPIARARAASAPGSPAVRAIIDAMRQGGMVLVLRHTATEPGRERELSEQGEKQARGVGKFLRGLNIHVGRAYCGQWPRTHNTARLAGFEKARTLDGLTDDAAAPATKPPEARLDEFRRLLRQPVGRPSNVLLVADANAIMQSLGVSDAVREGELIAVRPDPHEAAGFVLAGRIALRELRDEWRLRSTHGETSKAR